MTIKSKKIQMKAKVLYILVIVGFLSSNIYAQRGTKIGYIDTEYILQNLPEYQEASSRLDQKLVQWKSEIDKKLTDIASKKSALENEKILLTKELYDERYEDISFEEAEILDYQQKRFGPNGDMIIQQTQLMQPVQDQIFAAVNEIAETRKYDFIFDKNSDFLMLYSAERFDVSEQVLKIITRTSKREQAKTKEERKALEEESVIPEVNKEKDDRAKALEEKKEQIRLDRQKKLDEKRKKTQEARDARKKEAEARRQKTLDARKNRSNASKKAKDSIAALKNVTKAVSKVTDSISGKTIDSTSVKTKKQLQDEKRKKDKEDRQKLLEAKRKEIAEKKKKAREERLEKIRKNDSIRKARAEKKNN